MTPEERPLEVFGEVASRPSSAGSAAFVGATVPDRVIDGALVTRDGRLIPADAVIALPASHGPFIAACRTTTTASSSIDAHARVTARRLRGRRCTNEPVKQGGLAAQQADAAAEAIAAEAGAAVTPRPSRASCAPSCSPRTARWSSAATSTHRRTSSRAAI